MLHIEKELISYKVKDILEINNLSLDSSYKVIIEEILLSYSLKEKISEKNLKNIRTNKSFQLYLLDLVQKKMKNIITDSSCIQFSEMLNIINLLSYGKKYKIFTKYNQFSKDGTKEILKEYETLLENTFSQDQICFNIYFSFYTNILDSFIQVCIINSIDIKYKKNIAFIVELLQTSINTIKTNIELPQHYLDILNKTFAKSLLFFSNTNYVDTNEYTVDTLIYFFEQTLKKHIDAYSIFQSNKEDLIHYKTFLLTTTKLLLFMLKKLDSYKENYFYKLNIISKLYNKHFLQEERIYKGSENFKHNLLEKFVFIYDEKLNISYKQLLNIILEKNKLSHNDIILIHDFVLFDKSLDKNELSRILKTIINFKQEKNDYYENYRLKIIDITVNRFIELQVFQEKNEDVNLLITYLNKIEQSSHLLASYSKIHLTISLYYSHQNHEYLVLSKKHYYISKKMYSFDSFLNEYSDIFENILFNNASAYLENNFINHNILKKDLYNFGNNLMQEFAINENTFLNNQIRNKILDIIQNILNKSTYTKLDAKNDLSLLLSKKIFFSLCECTIIKSVQIQKNSSQEIYNILIQELNSTYSIVYKYSNFYEYNFKKIYEEKK